MKIKEKGITGRAAAVRRDQAKENSSRKGFNAFKEMERANKKSGGKSTEEKVEVFLEFMGEKVRIYDEDGGSVKEEDVPYVKGSALKFDGCEGEVNFAEIKVSFISYSIGKHCLITKLVGCTKGAIPETTVCQIRKGSDIGSCWFR